MIQVQEILSSLDVCTPMVIEETTTEADEVASRATFGLLNGASVGAQRYQGVPPWERHHLGEELLVVLDGEIDLDFIDAGQRRQVVIAQGMLAIIPKGTWHRPVAGSMVTLLAATPTQGSENYFGDIPPLD